MRKPGNDDYTMILAWLLAMGASISICYGASKGLGRRQDDIPKEWLRSMKQASWAFSVLYVSRRDTHSLHKADVKRTLLSWRLRLPSFSST